MDIGELNVVIGANLQPLQNSMNQATASMEKASRNMKAYFSRNFNAATKAMTEEMVKMQAINKSAFEESNRLMAAEMTKLVNTMSMKMAQAFSKANKVALAGVKTMVNTMRAEMAKGMNVTMIQNMPKGTLTPAQFNEKAQLEREKIASKEAQAWLRTTEAEKRREEINRQKDATRFSNESVKMERVAANERVAIEKQKTKLLIAQAREAERERERIRKKELAADKAVARVEAQIAKDRIKAELLAAKAANDAIKDKERRFQGNINLLRRTGWDIERIGQRATFALTLPIVTAGAAAYKMASDYDESLNKVKVAFGESSIEVERFAKKALIMTGMSEKMALTTAGLFGDMGTSMNLTRKEAAALAIELTQLVGDVASFKNMKFDEVKIALQGIFTGETESLKRMGVVMTVEAVQEWADAMGKGIKYSDLAIEDKLKLRAEYVKTFLKNSVGDFSRTFDATANQMRVFQSSLEELGASFGRIMMKTLTPILIKINAWMQSLMALNDETKKTIMWWLKLAAAIGPAMTIFGFFVGTIAPAVLQGIRAIGIGLKWLWGVIVANPYAAAAAGILMVAIALHKLYKQTDENAKITKDYNEAMDAATVGTRREMASITVLIQRTLKYNEGSAERFRLVKKLADAYPQYGINVLKATSSDEELLKIQVQINSELEKRIRLQALTARKKVADDKAIESQITADELDTQLEDFKRAQNDLFKVIKESKNPLNPYMDNGWQKIQSNFNNNYYKTNKDLLNALQKEYTNFILNFSQENDLLQKGLLQGAVDGIKGKNKIEKTPEAISEAFRQHLNKKLSTNTSEYNPLSEWGETGFGKYFLELENKRNQAIKDRNSNLNEAIRLEMILGKQMEEYNEELYKAQRAGMGYLEGLEADLQRADDAMKKASELDYIKKAIEKETIQKELDRALAIAGEAAKPIKVQLQLELKEIDIREKIAKATGQKYDATGARIAAYNKATEAATAYQAAGYGSKIREITGYSTAAKELKDTQLAEYLEEIKLQSKEIDFDAFVDQLAGLGDAGDVIKRNMDLMSAAIRKVQKDFIGIGPPTQAEADAMAYLQEELKRLGKAYSDFEITDFINKTKTSIETNKGLAEINNELGIQYDLAGENIEVYTAAVVKLNQALRENKGNLEAIQTALDNFNKAFAEEKVFKIYHDFNLAKNEIKLNSQAAKELGYTYDKLGEEIQNLINLYGLLRNDPNATQEDKDKTKSDIRLKESEKFQTDVSSAFANVGKQAEFS